MKTSAPLLISCLVLASCGGGGGGGGDGSEGSITLSGSVANVSKPTGPATASKAGRAFAGITDVVAVDTRKNLTFATKSGSNFSLPLSSGETYLIAFLAGTSTVAIYEAESTSTTAWNAFPVTSGSSDVDLGDVNIDLSNSVATGSTGSTTIAGNLGLAAGTKDLLGIWDMGMRRLADLDVDHNNALDEQEGKRYDLTLHYEFDPHVTFVQAQSGFSDHQLTRYQGYGYYFFAEPAGGGLDWDCATIDAAGGVLTADNLTSGLCSGAPAASNLACYNAPYSSGMTLNFFCGGGGVSGYLATDPVTPPTGTYTVTVPALNGTDPATTYVFHNLHSQTVSTTPENIYIPSVKLTLTGGKVTTLQVEWWKNDPTNGWVRATDAELASVLNNAGFEIGRSGWVTLTAADRVHAEIPLTATSTIAVPTQNFTPAVLRVSYGDKFGYAYGFEWQ